MAKKFSKGGGGGLGAGASKPVRVGASKPAPRTQKRATLRQDYKAAARAVKTARATGQPVSKQAKAQLRKSTGALKKLGLNIPKMRKFNKVTLPNLRQQGQPGQQTGSPLDSFLPSGYDQGPADFGGGYMYAQPQYGGLTLPEVPTYSSDPAALSAADLAQLDSMRIGADEDYKTALANRDRALTELDTNYVQNVGQINRTMGQARQQQGQQLMASMAAFSPGAGGRVARQLRDDWAGARSSAADTRTRGIADVTSMVQEAEKNRQRTIADIARQKAALTGDYRNYLKGVSY